MIAKILFVFSAVVAMVGATTVIMAKTGEQDTLGAAIVLGAAAIAVLGGIALWF